MKNSVVLLFALAVIGTLPSGNAVPQYATYELPPPQVGCDGCESQPLPPPCDVCNGPSGLNFPLGTLFTNYIGQCVQNAVQFVLQLVLTFIPTNLQIPIGQVVATLASEPNPTLCNLFQAAADAAGIDVTPILAITPLAILNTPVCLESLLQYLEPLLAQCPPGGTIPIGTLAPALANYLTSPVSATVVRIFNAAQTL